MGESFTPKITLRGSKTATIVGPFRGTTIGAPGRGKSTILIPALLAAGLPGEAVISLDEIRTRLYGSPNVLGGSEVEHEARRLEDSLMASERTVVRDSTGLNVKVRKAEVRRAHRSGMRAVALLSSPLSLAELNRRNKYRERAVPRDVLEMFHTKHSALVLEELNSEGFDQIVVWNDRTTFTLR